jgi:hypothetical protein
MTSWQVGGALAVVLALALGATGRAGPPGRPPHVEKKAVNVRVKRDGDAWCLDRAVRLGGVVIAGGRCYTFYVLRTPAGAFLGFGPPGPPLIPPGQLVRLATPAGAKVRGRLFYLVPVPLHVVAIPVETVRVVQVVMRPEADRLVVTIPRAANGGAVQSDVNLEHPFTRP